MLGGMAELGTRGIGRERRWGAVATGLVLLAVLAMGAWLSPRAEGHATHTQLGLPECGWVARFNKPCPTCGMTTAFALAAHGRFVEACRVQPFAAAAALASAIGFWAAAHVALTGSRLGSLFAGSLTPRVLWVMAATAASAWAYKLFTWN